MLKAVASTDKLVAEEKYKAPEEFSQSHTLILYTNHLPRVGSTDAGTWRRITVVPFNASIPSSKDIKNYSDILVQKAGGAIISWIVEGAVNFVKNDFTLKIPDAVIKATKGYRAREDWVVNFIAERCIKGDRVGGRALYLEYKEWAILSKEYIKRENDFVSAMEAAGYQKITSNGKKYWIGIRIGYG